VAAGRLGGPDDADTTTKVLISDTLDPGVK